MFKKLIKGTARGGGFTMIELLVVIAVIGVLAVAVLSAINPIEQINKGRDTGRRSDAGEVLGSVERYYASIGWYPWEITESTPPVSISPWADVDSKTDETTLILTKMVNTNEIKSGLQTRLTALGATDKVKIYFNGTVNGAGVYACFLPKSKSFETEAQVRCANATAWGTDAPTALACPGGAAACTAAGTCYICLP